jgi:hypothetical protein
VSIRRALSLLAALACLVGCSVFTSDLSADELRQLAEREKAAIYFVGQTEPPPKFATKLGSVEGKICQTTLITSMTEFQALSAMWASAQGKKATAVVDASCGTASFLLPTGGAYCYPGYYCKGEAVK